MSLIDELSKAHAALESRRDMGTALHAFTVLEAAAGVMESGAPREEFAAWVYAGQAASEGLSALRPVATSPYEVPVVTEDADDPFSLAESMAGLGSLLREVLVDVAHDNDDLDARLAALSAARCGTQIQTLLGE
ncbi:hypothetical protein [Planotetraspora sp. GP83]|uniref:hypothetical protein n=1 Tax=Planotetraspora sp. GP83 TaxID=3156264 RepID=UPI003515BA9D